MKNLPKNVWILTLGQALMMSASSMVVFVGGIIGAEIAPREEISTLPAACIILGTAISTIPIAITMKSLGRKRTFNLIIIASIAISLFTCFAIYTASFYLFCFCLVLLGFSVTNINQFRFAAMESVSPDKIPIAASTVLIGGIAAAFIGPEIALLSKNILDVDFSGSFLALSLLYILGLIVIQFYQNTVIDDIEANHEKPRSLFQILKQPIFQISVIAAVVGYSVMSFIMTATPVSMHVMDGHSLVHTKWVIQSHIVAMFLPSLFVAHVIRYLGVYKTMLLGIGAFGLCVIIGLSGHALINYWASLILLGIGWNFLFVGGTTLLPKTYRSNERFKVQALNDFMIFGTQAVAALSAGWVVFQLGWETMLLITSPILLIPILTILLNKNRK